MKISFIEISVKKNCDVRTCETMMNKFNFVRYNYIWQSRFYFKTKSSLFALQNQLNKRFQHTKQIFYQTKVRVYNSFSGKSVVRHLSRLFKEAIKNI